MFDLFIVGHTKKLGYAINNNEFTKNIIEECLKKGKFVYSYDEYQEFDQYINYYNPNVKWKDEYKSPLGKLYRSSTSVVGVFGTTSRQGKFSLQLLLRKKFLEEGYEVGQISSEPSGGLFGMDYCFPFGYSVKTDIVRKKMVEYINLLMHNMDSDKELIIVGCQSSILPYDCGNIADFTFSQIEFLFSTSPDCIILSVNSFDDFRDIDRIIRFMEAAVDTKVIALVVFPLKLRDEKAGIYSESIPMLDDEKELCLAKFREAFNKPVFILGEQIGEIYEIILNCF